MQKEKKKEIYFNIRLCIYLITNNQSIRTADYLNGSIKISGHIIATFLVLLLELLKFYWLLFYFIKLQHFKSIGTHIVQVRTVPLRIQYILCKIENEKKKNLKMKMMFFYTIKRLLSNSFCEYAKISNKCMHFIIYRLEVFVHILINHLQNNHLSVWYWLSFFKKVINK